jgi:hypothetical protein
MNSQEDPDNHGLIQKLQNLGYGLLKGLEALLDAVPHLHHKTRRMTAAGLESVERTNDVDALLDMAVVLEFQQDATQEPTPEPVRIAAGMKAAGLTNDEQTLFYMTREHALPLRVREAAGRKRVGLEEDVRVLREWARNDIFLPIAVREAAGLKAVERTDSLDLLERWLMDPWPAPDRVRLDSGLAQSTKEAAGLKVVMLADDVEYLWAVALQPNLPLSVREAAGRKAVTLTESIHYLVFIALHQDIDVPLSAREAAGLRAVEKAVEAKKYALLKVMSSPHSPADPPAVHVAARIALKNRQNPLAGNGMRSSGTVPAPAEPPPAKSGRGRLRI